MNGVFWIAEPTPLINSYGHSRPGHSKESQWLCSSGGVFLPQLSMFNLWACLGVPDSSYRPRNGPITHTPPLININIQLWLLS